MDIDIICIALRIIFSCLVFAFFLFFPFKNRLRHSYFKTAMLALLLTVITVGIIIFFLTSGKFLAAYSSYGIILWIFSAVIIFHIAIKGSSFELLFIVLVVLNLYVNIVAIAKVIENALNLNLPVEASRALIVGGVLIVYVPLLWFLMVKLYMQVIAFNIKFSFWRYIWIIPALNYMIFFVKIVKDYWKNPLPADVLDVVFVILWSFISYTFFCVTLQMLIQTYLGITAMEQTKLMTSLLRMQEDQYEHLLDNIEKTARLKHDWRHHLLSINSFAENGNMEHLQDYLKELVPEYLADDESVICSNHVVNTILQHHIACVKTLGVNVIVKANICKYLSISDIDLCIIFGNLVENAVEACIKQVDKHKFIEIKVEMIEKQLILMVKNSYQKEIIFKEDAYYSTKHEGVGIGLSSVKKVVEKNNGSMKIEYNGKCFVVYIRLNVS